MDSRSSVDRWGRAFFHLRLRQLVKEPACWLSGIGGMLLVSLSTFLGPLPPLDGGQAWRELLWPCGLLTGWVLAFLLLASPTGHLWSRLPALPAHTSWARTWWILAEALFVILATAPALLLGCLVLPAGPKIGDACLAGVVLGQVLVLGAVASWARDQGGGLLGGVLALTLVLTAISLPPLELVGPRPVGEAAQGWPVLFWVGLWISLLAGQQALLFRGSRAGRR